MAVRKTRSQEQKEARNQRERSARLRADILARSVGYESGPKMRAAFDRRSKNARGWMDVKKARKGDLSPEEFNARWLAASDILVKHRDGDKFSKAKGNALKRWIVDNLGNYDDREYDERYGINVQTWNANGLKAGSTLGPAFGTFG